MEKKGYKPIWTDRHTKLVKDFIEKKKTGKQIYYNYVDYRDFFDHLKDKSTLKSFKETHEFEKTKDEYGNVIYKIGKRLVPEVVLP